MTYPLKLITNAVSSRIDEAGLGFWDPTDAYPTDMHLPPIYAKRFPPKAPDKAIAINVYHIGVSVDPNDPVETYRVQIRSRAPIDADPVADPILELLHGAHHQMWGGINIQRCWHLSTGQLGMGSNDLDERTDNYELEILNG